MTSHQPLLAGCPMTAMQQTLCVAVASATGAGVLVACAAAAKAGPVAWSCLQDCQVLCCRPVSASTGSSLRVPGQVCMHMCLAAAQGACELQLADISPVCFCVHMAAAIGITAYFGAVHHLFSLEIRQHCPHASASGATNVWFLGAYWRLVGFYRSVKGPVQEGCACAARRQGRLSLPCSHLVPEPSAASSLSCCSC